MGHRSLSDGAEGGHLLVFTKGKRRKGRLFFFVFFSPFCAFFFWGGGGGGLFLSFYFVCSNNWHPRYLEK